MYILWDIVFVICMGIICRYFVGHGSFIYIYIYFERHGILICMRGMYGYFVGNVFGKYMEVWDK